MAIAVENPEIRACDKYFGKDKHVVVIRMSWRDICRDLGTALKALVIECSGWRVRGVYRVLLRIKDLEISLLVFLGRENYNPWAEFESLPPSTDVYGALEEILPLLRGIMGEGSRVMVPYIWDRETTSLLSRGVHPGATRLGSLMIESGYYLVRDMYYPEGFAEGSPKLVGEGYVDNKWYLESLLEELRSLEDHLSSRCSNRDPSCSYAERSVDVLRNALRRFGDRWIRSSSTHHDPQKTLFSSGGGAEGQSPASLAARRPGFNYYYSSGFKGLLELVVRDHCGSR